MPSSNLFMPRLTVAAIIPQQERFLMVEEYDGTRIVINQPAGHVEPSETPFAAVIRETFEETACKIQPRAIIGCYHYTPVNSNTSYFRICYLADYLEFHPDQSLDKDIISSKWLTKVEIAAMTGNLRSPLVLRCIDDYLKGQRYPLDMIADVC